MRFGWGAKVEKGMGGVEILPLVTPLFVLKLEFKLRFTLNTCFIGSLHYFYNSDLAVCGGGHLPSISRGGGGCTDLIYR